MRQFWHHSIDFYIRKRKGYVQKHLVAHFLSRWGWSKIYRYIQRNSYWYVWDPLVFAAIGNTKDVSMYFRVFTATGRIFLLRNYVGYSKTIQKGEITWKIELFKENPTMFRSITMNLRFCINHFVSDDEYHL